MQFTTARLIAFAAAISQAVAKVAFTNSAWAVEANVPFTITWSDADGPVTLLLKNGPSTDLATVSTIASGLTGTSFTWVPAGLPGDTYAVEISDSTDVNYSSQFVLSGTAPATTSSAPLSTATVATTTDLTTTTDMTTTPVSTTLTTASATPSTAGNTTSTPSTTGSTSTRTSGTTSSTTATNTPLNTNAGQQLGSPLALVLLTVAALMLYH
ncbi:unnamed protein product [Discula destructiva]